MKKILVLLIVFLALVGYVYFYELGLEETREEARRLEESLFRLEQDEILSILVESEAEAPILLEKANGNWLVKKPILAPADGEAVDALVRNIAVARSERTLEEGAERGADYGLEPPRLILRVGTGKEKRVLRIGRPDFTGSSVYVQFEGDSTVHLTSNYVLTTADKDLESFRSKNILHFERDGVNRVEIARPGEDLVLERVEERWRIVNPIEEEADQSAVRDFLSSIQFAENVGVVEESPADPALYGLSEPALELRLRVGEQEWKTLQVGARDEEAYLARDLSFETVFRVPESVWEKLMSDLWTFRDKDVVTVRQNEIERLTLRRGEEEIEARYEDFRWNVVLPEEFAGRELLSYRFWFPIDDIRFESIEDEAVFPETVDAELDILLTDGSRRRLQFARGDEDHHLARQAETGRTGRISAEAYQALHFSLEEALADAD